MKKNTLKKMLGLTLASSMAIGMLTGCGNDAPQNNKEASASPEVEQSSQATSSSVEQPKEYEYKTGITLTLSGKKGATTDWQSTDLIAGLEEKFGITINAEPIADDAWDTKITLAFAEEELADFYTCITMDLAKIGEYGADGYLLPLNEYLEHMPNLSKIFEENPDYKAACTSADGNIYTVVALEENPFNRITRNYIKQTWLDNLGLEYPDTLDDLYDVLKAFKEKDANGNGDPNDEIPLAFVSSYSRQALSTILSAFDITPRNNAVYDNSILEVNDNGEVYLADSTENYKAYLTFMNKLWEEELIYKEAYTAKITDIRALVKEDRVGVYGDAAPYVATGDPTQDQYWTWFAGLTSEYNATPEIVQSPVVGSSGLLMISADTEYPAEICRMIDWFFTDEGAVYAGNADISAYNPEYQEIALPGFEEVPIKKIVSDPPTGYETWETHRNQKRVINNSFNYRKFLTEGSTYYTLVNGSKEDAHLAELAKVGSDGWAVRAQMRMDEVNLVFGYPLMVYTADVASDRATLWTDISEYCKTMSAQFITGEVDIETGWAEFIETLETMGLSKLLKIEQDTYDRMYK